MKLQKLFIIIYGTIIFLLIILGIFSFLMLKNQTELKENNEYRNNSVAIAEELRNTSDDLTRFCRSYILTGDNTWKDKYFEVLDIRNGKKMRDNGKTIALIDSIKKLKLTKKEYEQLERAENNSNKLVYTEKLAFNAMKGFYDDGNGIFTVKKKPDSIFARAILFDAGYHAIKFSILKPINVFTVLLEQRTLKKSEEYEASGNLFLTIIIGLILLIVIITIISFIILRKRIINQILKLRRKGNEIYKSEKQYRALAENAIMAIIIHDIRGNIIYANQKAFEILNIKDIKNVYKTHVFKFVHPDYIVKTEDALKKILYENKTYQSEQKFITEDGISINVEIFAKVISYKNEQAVQITFKDITKHKIAESRLIESENKFRELFEKSGDAMLILENEKITDCNKAMVKMLNYNTKEEFLNLYPSEISPDFQTDGAESFEKARKMINIALKNRTHRFEWIHKKSTGEPFPVEVLLTTILNNSNRRIIHSVIRDISYRKEDQKQLLKFSKVVEQSFSTIVITDLNGNIEYVNPAFTKTTGYTFDEAIGKNPQILKSKKIESAEYTELWDTISKGETWIGEFLNIKKNKEEYWERAVVSPIKNANGEIINYLAIKSDITEQKITEEALKQSETHLRLSHKAGKIGTWEWNVKDGSLIWSDTAYHIFGIVKTEEKLTREIFLKNVHSDDKQRIITEIDISIEYNKTEHSTEYRFLKNSEIIWIEEKAEIIKNKKGEFVKMIGIIQDVTNKKIAKQALQKAKNEANNANNLKSEFLANMSHEIRTPMNAIIGFSEILQNKIKDKKQKSFIDNIVVSGNLLINLINDILDFSKIEAGQLNVIKEPTDIYKTIYKIPIIFSALLKNKNIPINVKIDKSVGQIVLTDGHRLNQMLINLVGNALKFTEKGRIDIVVSSTKSKINRRLTNISIKVKDTGIGIPEKDLSYIFDTFRQVQGQKSRKYGGTGLGLAITKKLTELLGGEIFVESEQGKGSTFTILLKNVEYVNNAIEGSRIEEEIKIEKISEKRIKILHVEDNEMNREVITFFTEDYNIELKDAENGQDALDILKTYTPDLILMDIQMPVLNGYEAAKIIRKDEKLKNIPIFAFTANATKEEIDKYGHIFDKYLTKPISSKAFKSAIANFIRGV